MMNDNFLNFSGHIFFTLWFLLIFQHMVVTLFLLSHALTASPNFFYTEFPMIDRICVQT